MSYVKNPSEKQKREWAQKAKQNVQDAFDMIRKIAEDYQRNPEHIAEYFSFAANFYHYSPSNVMMIQQQNENVTFVQSLKDWNTMGASIVKGAKGIQILVPAPITYLKLGENDFVQLSKATQEQKELYKKGEIEAYQKLSFKIGYVFDISQTTFPKERYPEIFNMGYSSEKHHAITQGLIHFSEREINCPVKYENMESISLLGYYVPGLHRISLNHLMEDTVQLSTMSHELGHALAHQNPGERSTAQIEFEGDAISIMLQKNYGIELTDERKSHLAAHFKRFCSECRNKVEKTDEKMTPEAVEEAVDKMVKESFSNIFEIYRNNIEVIEQYVSEEIDAHVSKVKNIFLQNGISEQTFDEWVGSGKLHIDNETMCSFEEGNVSLNISLNQFLHAPEQTAFYHANESADVLYVTQSPMEFMRELAHGRSVLLVENDMDPDMSAKLSGSQKYQFLEFGSVREDMKPELQKKLDLPEYRHMQTFVQDMHMQAEI